MHRSLIILHDEPDGPGELGNFLKRNKASVVVKKPYAGDELPGGVNGFDSIASMGGDMNVHQADIFPFLVKEEEFLRRAVESGTPVLGVCLGAQMIAKALGGEVKESPVTEIGFFDVELTGDGERDKYLHGLDLKFKAFQWHRDCFVPPPGSRVLAASSGGQISQAFRYKNALAIQFHPEVNYGILKNWFASSRRKDRILNEFQELEPAIYRLGQAIFANFFGL